MVGDIISEQWAELSRNGGRLHSEIVGDIDQNPQAVRGDVDCRPRWPLATLAAPIYLATPPGPRGRTGHRAMVNHVFVTDHPQPHPRVVPLQTLTRYDAPARSGTCVIGQLQVSKVAGDIAQATAWLRAWPEAPRPAR